MLLMFLANYEHEVVTCIIVAATTVLMAHSIIMCTVQGAADTWHY